MTTNKYMDMTTIAGISASFTITGNRIPTRSPARILVEGDRRVGFISEIIGPVEAFRVFETPQYNKVRVIEPDLVTIKTFQVL